MKFWMRTTYFLLCLAFSVQISFACSMSKGFVAPTNFELVERAEAIVVAKATKQVKGKDRGKIIYFEVTNIIKGAPPKIIKTNWGYFGKVEPSDPNDISSPHPDSWTGACSRQTFKKGNEYLLFLSSYDGGELGIGVSAYARDREDYAGANSLWATTVDYYVEVQKTKDRYAQLETLANKYEALKLAAPDSDGGKLAKDIAGHFKSYSPYKPTQYLLNAYTKLDTGKPLSFPVRHPGADKEGGDVAAISDALFALIDDPSEKTTNNGFSTQEQKLFILWSLANGKHPEAKAFFKELVTKESLSPATLGAATAYLASNKEYEYAAELARTHALIIVTTSPKDEMQAYMRGYSRISYLENNDKEPLWMSFNKIKAWWPQFDFAVTEAIWSRYGSGHIHYSKGVPQALRPSNYRNAPRTAVALARQDDGAVIAWAEKEVWRLIELEESAFSKKYNLPIRVLLIDNNVETMSKLDNVFCHKDRGRAALLKNLGLEHRKYRTDLAVRIAANYRILNKEERETLLRSLTMLSAVDWHEYVENGGKFDNIYIELIEKIISDKPILPTKRHYDEPNSELICK